MNKVMTAALAAGCLMLLNSPDAAAHKEARYSYQPPSYYDYGAFERSRHMPRWLKHNTPFRKWYRHSNLKRQPWLAWDEVFEIYRWERRHGYRYDTRYRADKRYRNDRRRGPRHGERRHRH